MVTATRTMKNTSMSAMSPALVLREEPGDERGPGQDLDPGQDEGGEEGDRPRHEPIIVDVLGEAEGVGDLEGAGVEEEPADDDPEDEEDGPIPDHSPVSPGRPAAAHSAHPPWKTRMSVRPRPARSRARPRLDRQSPPEQ